MTENLRKVTNYAAKHEIHFMKLLVEQNEDGGKRRDAAKRKELDAAEKRIAELQKKLAKTREATANAEKFMNVIRKHTAFEELTPTLLREFVEKIVVHEATAADERMHGNLRR